MKFFNKLLMLAARQQGQKNWRAKPPADGRQGIALVIVLGLLALLMITTVTFTIMMRVERAGSSNLRHVVGARQMARGALAYAIATIDDEVADDIYPAWTNREFEVRDSDEVRRVLKFPAECLRSVDTSISNKEDVAHARVVTAETMRYLPKDLQVAAERIDGFDPPEWIPVFDQSGDVIGRYAFVILNSSGRLDANVVNATNRWMGNNPGEIQLHPDAEPDVLNTNQLVVNRNKYGRFETLPELKVLTTNEVPLALDVDNLANFDVFSYALPELMPEAGKPPSEWKPKIDISTEALIQSQKAEIMKAFEASGLENTLQYNDNVSQVKSAYLGLLDYVDKDDVPAGDNDTEKFARPAVEAVPMFSQALMQCELNHSPVDVNGNVTNTLTSTFLFTFTCPNLGGVQDTGYTADIAFEFVNDTANPEHAALLPPSQIYELKDVSIPMSKGSHTGEILFPDAEPPHSFTLTRVLPQGTKPAFRFGFVLAVRVKNRNGIPVDQVPYNYNGKASSREILLDGGQGGLGNAPLEYDHTLEDAFIEPGRLYDFWVECLDPRMNGDVGMDNNFRYWFAGHKLTSGIIPGYTVRDQDAENLKDNLCSLAQVMLDNPAALKAEKLNLLTDGARRGDTAKEHTDHPQRQFYGYVANAPLKSVGELGYLPIGAWLTINLFDHGHDGTKSAASYVFNVLPERGYHTVLDYFTVRPQNSAVRGKVNLATRNPEVLAAVFNNMPLREGIASDAHLRISPTGNDANFDDSTELAEWIMNTPNRTNPRTGKLNGPFERLSDLGKIFRGTSQLGARRSNLPTAKEPAQLIYRAMDPQNFSELEREALIRNAAELFTMRQQIYTIIIRADSFSPFYGMVGVQKGSVLATTSAVAQIWRDPYPDKDDKHSCFVQFFKIIGE